MRENTDQKNSEYGHFPRIASSGQWDKVLYKNQRGARYIEIAPQYGQ